MAGGVAVVVVLGAWFFFGDSDPEDDLTSLSIDKRLRAIETLEQKDTPAAARAIVPYTMKADSPDDIRVARRSLFAIGRMKNGGETSTLIDAMAHPKMEIREAAVAAMGTRREKADRPALRERLMKDPSPEVRTAAAAELGGLRDSDGLAALAAALDDQDETVQNAAIRSLLDIGGREHQGFKPGATPQQRAQMIQQLKRDWPSFKAVNETHLSDRKIMQK